MQLGSVQFQSYFQSSELDLQTLVGTQTSRLLGPSNDTILYLNKPKIIGNGGELSDLEYLPTKIEKVKNIQNVGAHTSRLLGPFK